MPATLRGARDVVALEAACGCLDIYPSEYIQRDLPDQAAGAPFSQLFARGGVFEGPVLAAAGSTPERELLQAVLGSFGAYPSLQRAERSALVASLRELLEERLAEESSRETAGLEAKNGFRGGAAAAAGPLFGPEGALEQRSPAWFAARAGRLTGSAFGDALGFWPEKRAGLWEEKLGLRAPFKVQALLPRCVRVCGVLTHSPAGQRGDPVGHAERAKGPGGLPGRDRPPGGGVRLPHARHGRVRRVARGLPRRPAPLGAGGRRGRGGRGGGYP